MADTIHDLEAEARHVKYMMDLLSKAYIGITTEEIIRLAFGNTRKEEEHDDRNNYSG